MKEFLKKHWVEIVGGLVTVFLFKGCFTTTATTHVITHPAASLTQQEKDRLYTIAFGSGPTWEQLSYEDKLNLADLFLTEIEHKKLDIDAQYIVDQMEKTNYGQNTTTSIGDEIISILNQEEVKEGKNN